MRLVYHSQSTLYPSGMSWGRSCVRTSAPYTSVAELCALHRLCPTLTRMSCVPGNSLSPSSCLSAAPGARQMRVQAGRLRRQTRKGLYHKSSWYRGTSLSRLSFYLSHSTSVCHSTYVILPLPVSLYLCDSASVTLVLRIHQSASAGVC